MLYKHDYDKTLTRLVVILKKLYEGEELSVKELAEEFNVSTRTIQRDFNEKLVSFPIYQDKKKWKMQEGFKIEKSTSIEEQVILDIMDKLYEGMGSEFSAKAKKLLSKIKNNDFNPIYTKLNMEDISNKLDIIQSLESCIKSKEIIKLKYTFEDKRSFNLKLKPLKIANFEGFWYLIALDTKDNDTLKKYYLKNISNIKNIDENFEINSSLEELLKNAISIWFQENTKPFEVKINVSSSIAKYIKRKAISPTQSVESIYEDGSMDIVVKITHEMEIIPIIKYWLPKMKVLEPKWIDAMVKDDLEKYLEN